MAARCRLALAVAAISIAAGALAAPRPALAAARAHVVVIVLENREYDEVAANPAAPFLNQLAARGALATNYHAVTHPSLPNYLALLGGSTFGIGDQKLASLVPRITRRLGPHGLLVVSFDEGTSDAGCCGDPGGGRVFTVLAGPDVRHGVRLRAAYDHYSLLAGLEDAFGLPRLRQARGARPLPLAIPPLGH